MARVKAGQDQRCRATRRSIWAESVVGLEGVDEAGCAAGCGSAMLRSVYCGSRLATSKELWCESAQEFVQVRSFRGKPECGIICFWGKIVMAAVRPIFRRTAE